MIRMPHCAAALLMSLLVLPHRAIAQDELHHAVPVRSGGSLVVDLAMGAIEIESHDESEVRVDAQSRGWGSGSMRFELTSDGTDAKLTGETDGWHVFNWPNVRVRIRVPEAYSLDLKTGGGGIEIDDLGGSVRAKTSGGSIQVDGAVGLVDLNTSGGEIEAENIEGDLIARTSGGRVHVSDVTGSIEVRTSGGRIEVLDVGGPVAARTSGGPVEVRFNGAPAGHIQTSGGSIEVEFAEGYGMFLDARTSGGRVRLDEEFVLRGNMERSRAELEVNGGGERLELRTSGGNIRIRGR